MEIILITDAPRGGTQGQEYEVPDGTTVGQFFDRVFPRADRYARAMLVNRYPVDWDHRLRHMDEVSVRAFRHHRPAG